MMPRANTVTSTDVALLRSIGQERSVVAASRRVGISRDRAVYRIERLERAFGGAVVRGIRGGTGHGGTTLTALGDRIVRGGFDSVELLGGRPLTPISAPNILHGTYRKGAASPEVRVSPGLVLKVAFPANDGEPVSVILDPESVVVARRRFPSSARNVISGTVEGIRQDREELGLTLLVRCPGTRLRISMTEEPVRQLRIKPGVRVWLYVKATALRRIGEIPVGVGPE